jgi:DNA repair protein RadB
MEKRLSTSCEPFDRMLEGVFQFGKISLIYGETATGKTTLAMSCVFNHLRDAPKAKVLYIDTDGGPSTKRMEQIVGEGDSLLERILIWGPDSFSEQTTIVESMQPLVYRKATIIVVDSITSLYRLEAGDAEKTFKVNKELNRQLGFLAETAETSSAAVLLTGQVHGVVGDPAQVEPVAQRLLRYWSDIVLKLETTSRPGVRQAVLEKGREAPRSCMFKLTNRGLSEVDGTW